MRRNHGINIWKIALAFFYVKYNYLIRLLKVHTFIYKDTFYQFSKNFCMHIYSRFIEENFN